MINQRSICPAERSVRTAKAIHNDYTYRPSDKAAINALTPLSAGASLAIDSMVSRNMLSPVLQQSQYLDNSLTQRSLTNYQVWDSHVIAPQNIQAQLAATH